MYALKNTVLQEMWEKLTNAKFNTNDGKPYCTGSCLEEKVDVDDFESSTVSSDDTPLTRTMILKDILEREVRIILEKIDMETPARKHISNEVPRKAKRIKLDETTKDKNEIKKEIESESEEDNAVEIEIDIKEEKDDALQEDKLDLADTKPRALSAHNEHIKKEVLIILEKIDTDIKEEKESESEADNAAEIEIDIKEEKDDYSDPLQEDKLDLPDPKPSALSAHNELVKKEVQIILEKIDTDYSDPLLEDKLDLADTKPSALSAHTKLVKKEVQMILEKIDTDSTDSCLEEKVDVADFESSTFSSDDTPLTSTMILKNILQREVRIILEKIDIDYSDLLQEDKLDLADTKPSALSSDTELVKKEVQMILEKIDTDYSDSLLEDKLELADTKPSVLSAHKELVKKEVQMILEKIDTGECKEFEKDIIVEIKKEKESESEEDNAVEIEIDIKEEKDDYSDPLQEDKLDLADIKPSVLSAHNELVKKEDQMILENIDTETPSRKRMSNEIQ
ncbi:hypothetical protein K1T71_000760 [Dendrolimus kikuchii]|uniref:Uncharacterized protein n=1 Tax=Dendrolimus kikuchii TaxID=765133 RepID=A0ACC1DKA5_9NEOP|nr:hypothetical protein K1T71_000760 [Dendrolimus kikuchii]